MLLFNKRIIVKNICPMWSTEKDNITSDKLAKSVGFEKLADTFPYRQYSLEKTIRAVHNSSRPAIIV